MNNSTENNINKRPAKHISESRTEQQYLIRPAHMNHYGRLFGGELLRWIDELAGIVARRHANANITTAAIDNLQFKAPVYAISPMPAPLPWRCALTHTQRI